MDFKESGVEKMSIQRLYNKKGSTMVEAALVYPMILAATMAVIYILISLYCATSIKAYLYTFLRAEGLLTTETGEQTHLKNNALIFSDKYSRAAFRSKISLTKENHLLYATLNGSINHTYKGNALLFSKTKTQYGRLYVIDEKEYMRKVDLIKYEAS